jgi:hypothetical protein
LELSENPFDDEHRALPPTPHNPFGTPIGVAR